jgi:branched-chain amino acid transport system substrate-binding protein
MHVSKPALLVLFWCFLFSMLNSCNRSSTEPENPKEIRIGVILPFTGSSASSGLDAKSGIELAAFIINNPVALGMPLASGSGLPRLGHSAVSLIFKDSRGDEKSAPQLVDELVKQDRVSAVIGCYNSAVTAAASETAEILQIPFLNPDSTSPILTQRGLKWFFRTTPDDQMFVNNFFEFFAELEQQKKIELSKRLVLVYENRLWGTSVARAEKKQAAENGYRIVADIPYSSQDRHFVKELSKINASMPAIILQASYAEDAVLFMKGYKSLGIRPTAVLGMNAGFISPFFGQQLGSDAQFVLSREVWAPDIQEINSLAKEVNQMFFKQFNRDMTGNSARGFTGLIVLAEAINRAGDIEADRIRKALLQTELDSRSLIMPWEGVKFDPETGQNILGQGIIVQRMNNQYHTVWPFNLATRPIVWPMPAWDKRDSN